MLPLQPYRTRIPVKDVAPAAHEKPSKSSPKDNDVQVTKDVADKEGQHQMTEDEQVLQDKLLKKKRGILHLKRGQLRLPVLTNLVLLGHIGAYDDDDVGAEADFNNMDNTIDVSPIPTLKVHKDHPKGQILGDPKLASV
ncbi:hypothetical protein Tco_0021983 [Tanacetum coccineum]